MKEAEHSQITEKIAQHEKNQKNVYGFNKGVQHKLTFLSHTALDRETTIENSDTVMQQKGTTPAITHTAAERTLFSLLLNMGDLNILTLKDRITDLDWSKLVTSHLDENVIAAEKMQYNTNHQIKKRKYRW